MTFKISKTRNILSLVCVLIIGLLPFSAFSQQNQVSADVVSVKIDGRFKAKLRTDDSNDVNKSNGLVRQLEIEFEWWSLLGQPVEKYGLKWERGDVYRLDGKELRRSELEKYPDLLARYDALKPSEIEVAFGARLYAYEEFGGGWEGDEDANAFGENYYTGGDVSATKITDNFLITDSGRFMDDFLPSSPRDWQSFIKWSSNYNDGTSVQDANIATQNTFKAAKRIRFNNLRINKITLPNASAKAILEEFERKEKKKLKEADEKEPQGTEVDYWGLTDKDAETTTSKPGAASDTDYWGERTASSETSEDKFWGQRPKGKTAPEVSFEISNNDQGQGVISPNGKVLIPFREWKIEKFREGLAYVLETNSEEVSRKPAGCPRSTTSGGYTACLLVYSHNCTNKVTTRRYWVSRDGDPVSDIELKTFEETEGC